MGGLKAVIYTDTIQWIILLAGLIFIGLPLGFISIGGMEGLRAETDQALLSLTNLSWQNIVNWSITIIPIWFIGMTLYQRIYASRDVKQAKKAWYIAGLFEWPIMAFMGVLLGLFAKVAAEQGMFAEIGYASAAGMDAEIGLPLLLPHHSTRRIDGADDVCLFQCDTFHCRQLFDGLLGKYRIRYYDAFRCFSGKRRFAIRAMGHIGDRRRGSAHCALYGKRARAYASLVCLYGFGTFHSRFVRALFQTTI